MVFSVICCCSLFVTLQVVLGLCFVVICGGMVICGVICCCILFVILQVVLGLCFVVISEFGLAALQLAAG